jgi:RNA polymerase sigma-70 factor, ECF subfamily
MQPRLKYRQMSTPLEEDSALLDETTLIGRIARQEQTALSELYDRYARVLYALAFKILGTAEEAEEVVLDVFHQVWRTASSYSATRGRVDTWLFVLTRSRALDRLRTMGRRERSEIAVIDATQIQVRSPFLTPEEDALICEQRSIVLTALQQLPVEQRQVLELAYFQGMTHAEIAECTGRSLGTVKTRIRLGLSKLRQLLNAL